MKAIRLRGTAVPLRVVSALFGLFCLIFVPHREMINWSSLHMVLYYISVTCFTAMATIRLRSVSRSFWLTLMLSCLSAIPFFYTASGILLDVFRSHSCFQADGIVWTGLTVILLILAMLPAALLLEFWSERKVSHAKSG